MCVFFGFVEFVSRSLHSLAQLSVPLIEIIKQNVLKKWNAQKQDTFEKIKVAATSALCLALIDYTDESKEQFFCTRMHDQLLLGIY